MSENSLDNMVNMVGINDTPNYTSPKMEGTANRIFNGKHSIFALLAHIPAVHHAYNRYFRRIKLLTSQRRSRAITCTRRKV